MHAIPNHRNSDFQIIYFLVGSCHTPDGAYALLCNLREDRESALSSARTAELKNKAKLVRMEEKSTQSRADFLEFEAEVEEVEALRKITNKNKDAAERELTFINKAIERLHAHRKYKNFEDHEAHQMAQREEWKLELVLRAENFLLSGGAIPADHLATMRQHPDYLTDLVPVIVSLTQAMHNGGQLEILNKVNAGNFNFSKLLTD